MQVFFSLLRISVTLTGTVLSAACGWPRPMSTAWTSVFPPHVSGLGLLPTSSLSVLPAFSMKPSCISESVSCTSIYFLCLCTSIYFFVFVFYFINFFSLSFPNLNG